MLAFAALLVAAVPFGIVVGLVVTSWGPLLRLDRHVAGALHRFALTHHTFTTVMKLISAVGGPVGWWVVLTATFGLLLYRHRLRLAAFVAVTALGSSLLNTAIKTLVDRARPRLANPVAAAAGNSFPSGHAQAATVGCGILLVAVLPVIAHPVRRWLIAAGVCVVAVIGFSRIALGVHYLSDVVGAYLIGIAWLLAMIAAFATWRRDWPRPPVQMSGEPATQRQRALRPGGGDDRIGGEPGEQADQQSVAEQIAALGFGSNAEQLRHDVDDRSSRQRKKENTD